MNGNFLTTDPIPLQRGRYMDVFADGDYIIYQGNPREGNVPNTYFTRETGRAGDRLHARRVVQHHGSRSVLPVRGTADRGASDRNGQPSVQLPPRSNQSQSPRVQGRPLESNSQSRRNEPPSINPSPPPYLDFRPQPGSLSPQPPASPPQNDRETEGRGIEQGNLGNGSSGDNLFHQGIQAALDRSRHQGRGPTMARGYAPTTDEIAERRRQEIAAVIEVIDELMLIQEESILIRRNRTGYTTTLSGAGVSHFQNRLVEDGLAYRLLTGFTPILGTAIDIIESVTGRNIFTGEDLGDIERGFTIFFVGLGVLSDLPRLLRSTRSATEVALRASINVLSQFRSRQPILARVIRQLRSNRMPSIRDLRIMKRFVLALRRIPIPIPGVGAGGLGVGLRRARGFDLNAVLRGLVNGGVPWTRTSTMSNGARRTRIIGKVRPTSGPRRSVVELRRLSNQRFIDAVWAHAWGPGFGRDMHEGLLLAGRKFNSFQNSTIENLIRRIARDQGGLTSDVDLFVDVVVESWPRTGSGDALVDALRQVRYRFGAIDGSGSQIRSSMDAYEIVFELPAPLLQNGLYRFRDQAEVTITNLVTSESVHRTARF